MIAEILKAAVALGEFIAIRRAADTATVGDDEWMYQLEKTTEDAVSNSEWFLVTPVKGVADGAAAADALVRGLVRALADAVVTADRPEVTRASLVSGGDAMEFSSVADVARLTVGRAISDAAAGNDATAIEAGKALADLVGAADSAVLTWDAYLDKLDAVGVSDAASLTPGKVFEDLFGTLVDAFAFAVSKAAADGVTATDAAARDAAKVAADGASTAEAMTRQAAKARADVVAGVDAGAVELSDYAEDYFAEDYVLTQMLIF